MQRSLKILDPAGVPPSERFPYAPRLESLAGARLGVFSNGKPNALEYLQAAEAQLHERFVLGEVVTVDLLSEGLFAHAAPDWMLEQLSRCDAVLHGCGD